MGPLRHESVLDYLLYKTQGSGATLLFSSLLEEGSVRLWSSNLKSEGFRSELLSTGKRANEVFQFLSTGERVFSIR